MCRLKKVWETPQKYKDMGKKLIRKWTTGINRQVYRNETENTYGKIKKRLNLSNQGPQNKEIPIISIRCGAWGGGVP